MIFPENIEQKLNFERIKFLVADNCLSQDGIKYSQQLSWSKNYSQISLWQIQNKEAIHLVQSGKKLLEWRVPSIDHALSKLKLEGSVLTPAEIHDIRLQARLSESIFRLLYHNKELYPTLHSMLADGKPEQKIIDIADRVIDEKGEIKSNASPALADILQKANRAEKEIHRKIASLYEKYNREGFLAETELTVKDGRPVLPVLSEHKRRIAGYVHDESATGKILYIEPQELIEINNLHTELLLEKRREIDRILRKTTTALMSFLPQIKENNRLIGVFDFIQAKAFFALKINASVPFIAANAESNFKNAVHPLLYLNTLQQSTKIVSQHIKLDANKRLMIISGPNGGGKSVTLKTAGLLQYMLQSGLPVTASADSLCGIYSSIYLDIGDDQSVDNNLSSYTSHLLAMKHISEHAGNSSLVLIDELGNGTDPAFGGPMAEAFLYKLNTNGCYGIITTHFSNLKKLAEEIPGIFNASMGYDTHKLEPLYTLIPDKPGSSFAFEAAIKVGISDDILAYAKKATDQRIINLDKLLADTEAERNTYTEQLLALEQKEKMADKLISEYTQLKKEFADNRKSMMDMAREKALTIIEDANRDVENTIRQIKKTSAEKDETKALRIKLSQKKSSLKAELGFPEFSPSNNKQEKSALKPGEMVKITGGQTVAEVLEIKGETTVIITGSIKSRVKTADIEKVSPETDRLKAVNRRGVDLIEMQKDFKSEIDVRGLRTEEALQIIEKWLDEAHVLGMGKLRIIHGKGDGILKKMIRNYLRHQSIVLNIASEHADMGGDGVSLVEIR